MPDPSGKCKEHGPWLEQLKEFMVPGLAKFGSGDSEFKQGDHPVSISLPTAGSNVLPTQVGFPSQGEHGQPDEFNAIVLADMSSSMQDYHQSISDGIACLLSFLDDEGIHMNIQFTADDNLVGSEYVHLRSDNSFEENKTKALSVKGSRGGGGPSMYYVVGDIGGGFKTSRSTKSAVHKSTVGTFDYSQYDTIIIISDDGFHDDVVWKNLSQNIERSRLTGEQLRDWRNKWGRDPKLSSHEEDKLSTLKQFFNGKKRIGFFNTNLRHEMANNIEKLAELLEFDDVKIGKFHMKGIK